MQTRNAKELAKELTALPLSLLNTHADPDHIGSNDEFDSFYMHPAVTENTTLTALLVDQLIERVIVNGPNDVSIQFSFESGFDRVMEVIAGE